MAPPPTKVRARAVAIYACSTTSPHRMQPPPWPPLPAERVDHLCRGVALKPATRPHAPLSCHFRPCDTPQRNATRHGPSGES
eukprot:5869926-Prymnesium_polylepis.1